MSAPRFDNDYSQIALGKHDVADLDFTFRTTPWIISRPGASAEIGSVMNTIGCTKVGVVCDEGIRSLGLVDAALDSLAAAGIGVEIFSGVVADPPAGIVLDAVYTLGAARIDGVVGLGGGSSLDTAKLVALLLGTEQQLDAMYGIDKARGPRLPLVLVPTTAGTGSEVTPIAIVTTEADEKKGIVSPVLLPDCALLDALLTVKAPSDVTAATGVDAMVHAIEAFTSLHRKNTLSDCLALRALSLLSANIKTACEKPDDIDARTAMLLGATLAGMAFANAPVAAVHALAYPLGGHFHVPHGLSNALVLPHVLVFNRPVAETLYGELAPAVFPHLSDRATGERVTGLIDGLRNLVVALGLQTGLTEVGVTADDVPKLADDAMKQSRLLQNNPRPMSRADAVAIYQAALVPYGSRPS